MSSAVVGTQSSSAAGFDEAGKLVFGRVRAAGPALYLAATLCKSVVVPAPAAVAALDATLLSRRAGAPRLLRRVAATTARDLAGYAAVAAVVVPVTLRANALGHDPDADVIVLHTGAQRCAKALVTIWFCLGKAAYPAGLSPHYALRDLYFEAGHDDGEARLALACFVAPTAGCAALALAGLDGGAALAAWVYVVAAFLPTCGLVQHGMVQKGGDRYLYLPTLGLAVLGAVAVAVAGDRARGGSGSGASTSGAGAPSAPPPPAPVAPVPPRRRAAAAAAVAGAAAALVAALVDVTAEMGPFVALPGSHRAVAAGAFPDDEERVAVPFLVRPGDVTVYSSQLIHRGGANTAARPRPPFHIAVMGDGAITGGMAF